MEIVFIKAYKDELFSYKANEAATVTKGRGKKLIDDKVALPKAEYEAQNTKTTKTKK